MDSADSVELHARFIELITALDGVSQTVDKHTSKVQQLDLKQLELENHLSSAVASLKAVLERAMLVSKYFEELGGVEEIVRQVIDLNRTVHESSTNIDQLNKTFEGSSGRIERDIQSLSNEQRRTADQLSSLVKAVSGIVNTQTESGLLIIELGDAVRRISELQLVPVRKRKQVEEDLQTQQAALYEPLDSCDDDSRAPNQAHFP